MQIECKENLESIAFLLHKLTPAQYQHPSQFLSGATIGQHIRHILEFYTCLAQAFSTRDIVNYDQRKRSMCLENDPREAIGVISDHITWLQSERIVGEIHLAAAYATSSEKICRMPSSYQRELAYCLEHSIHHQALIKIGLLEQGLEDLIEPEFGVAPSTIKFRQQKDLESA